MADHVWFWNWKGGGWNTVGTDRAPTRKRALAYATEFGADVRHVLVPDAATLRRVSYDWLNDYEARQASACD